MLAWVISALVVSYVALSLFLLFSAAAVEDNPPLDRKKRAAVLVVGDLGHSPRMCFHALSIADRGWQVSLIGNVESDLMAETVAHDNIEVVPLPPISRAGPFILYVLKRMVFQHYHVWRALKSCGKLDVVMVQNPPAVPTLASARFFTLFTCPAARLIIDWHNFGHTILAMSVKNKWALQAYKVYEFVFGRVASIHLTVTTRMGMVLRSRGVRGERILPLHDRPFKSYVVTSKSDKQRLKSELFSDVTGDLMLVTSTSYTVDEDLGMLLDGLAIFDGKIDAEGGKNAPKSISLIVTGKGPGKAAFDRAVSEKQFKRVTVHTRWLPYDQYHQLLSVCDLGISLHKSSSGYDLPMKVVDMFGAGLPVLALKFPALDELVNDQNGLVFNSAETLAQQLVSATDSRVYAKIREGAVKEAANTWTTEWDARLGPIFMMEPPGLVGDEVLSLSESD